ncbi:MAG: EAL domain-containing protein [Sphingomonas sp.]|nr:EAL domain-containing protein [Sphingomonas sp.]
MFVTGLSSADLFVPIEDALNAKRSELLERKPTGETVIVEMDARSLVELRSWPWPRRYHAEVVNQLHRSGASIIAFDVDFSARSGTGDPDLAAAIRNAGHVVLPIFAQASSGRVGDTQVLASRPDAAFADAWVGGVNIFPDRDGVVREYPAALAIDGAIQPSIATLLAESNAVGDRSFQPDWAIDAGAIPRFSFVDVMHGRFRPGAFRGKRVLIGATAIELGDRYAVPRYGVVPGVVVQAMAAESLLQDRAVERTGSVVTIFGILLIALAFSPHAVERPGRYSAACAATAATIAGGPILVQAFWPVSVDSAAWLTTLAAAISIQAILEARRRLRLREQIDAESGLPNRSVLQAAIPADSSPSVVHAASIERFERIRDGIGLVAANEMIRKVADQITAIVGSPVYRIAPDILAWILPHEDESTLREIQSAFRAPVVTQAGPVDVAMTVGIDREEEPAAAVLRIERALSAITTARSKGRNHDHYRGSDPQVRSQLSLMSDLRQAMEKGRLSLAYQPKMALETGRIGDAEALIRWHDGNGKTVSPDEFIPLAEATGVIREVTIFALRTAAADLSRWAREGVAMRAAVNVSALDVAAEGFADEVSRILAKAGVPTSQLTLEVTESALIRSPAEAIATLTALRALGIRLSVDDYGTGQSTLSYLKHLPVHELKIDKSFVTTLVGSKSDAIMVRSTINLAHELGLEVVAEGIEDRETLEILRSEGCDYAQGYFVGKPLGPAEFFEFVSGRNSSRKVA